jgi:NAD(P)-dependent dehydrogenase (short-subunit alcohol dehydrogenase family)
MEPVNETVPTITVNTVAPGFIETDMTDVLPDMVKQELMKTPRQLAQNKPGVNKI